MDTPDEPPTQKPEKRVATWFTMVTLFRSWLRMPGGESTVQRALEEAKRKEQQR